MFNKNSFYHQQLVKAYGKAKALEILERKDYTFGWPTGGLNWREKNNKEKKNKRDKY